VQCKADNPFLFRCLDPKALSIQQKTSVGFVLFQDLVKDDYY